MFQGFEHDVVIAAAMYDYLSGTIDRLCAAYIRELGYTKYPAKIGDAHKKAASSAVCAKLRELQAEREREFSNSTGTALVVFKMAQVQAEFGEVEYVNKNLVTRKCAEAYAATRRGDRDGRSINLNTQIDNQEQKVHIA